ncbi:hypothetical protein O2F38_13775, partial [Lacticaseibacillus rhamnosus]|nr:hypothetical protein [Lacticaseibacillus rhamnosus]
MKNYLSFGMFALLFALTFGTVKPVQAASDVYKRQGEGHVEAFGPELIYGFVVLMANISYLL